MRNTFNLISSFIMALIVAILFVILVNFLVDNWLYEFFVVLISVATFVVFMLAWAFIHDAVKEWRK